MRAIWSFCLATVAVTAASAVHAETATVKAADCKRLAQHVPAKGVEYQPGVGANGKKVAPADANGGYPNMMPEEITIRIGVDLADRLAIARAKAQGNPAPTAANRPLQGYTSAGSVGTVTFKGGTVYWNDQPLAPQDEAALAEACRASLAAAAPPPAKPGVPQR